MKKSVLAIVAGIAMVMLSSAGSVNSEMFDNGKYTNDVLNSQQQKTTAVKEVYSCPMHPEVTQDKPGKCTKCGMSLVKKEAAKDVYACPMHPEVSQDKPGKCTKCGMDLVKKDISKVIYTCPMHSDVKQDKAGKCPKCGMNLVKM